jgi:hypothetical protein
MKSKLIGISVSSDGRRAYLLRLLLLAMLLVIQKADRVQACSAVTSSANSLSLVAANYDWTARGGIVFESPRGQRKQSIRFHQDGATASWRSKYASLTVSQFGRDFPMQGLNEAGLMGIVLVAPADYPRQGPLGVIAEVSWLQYQLDQFATVEEVIAHAGDFGIEKVSAYLHWYLCDARHTCIIVEFERGQPVIHQLDPQVVRAATNSSFRASSEALRSWQSSGSEAVPHGYQSINRYIRLANRDSFAHEWQLVEAIDDVALQGFTAFQTIFDSQSKELRVRLPNSPWQILGFDQRSLACTSKLEMYNLQTGAWQSYDYATVDRLFAAATDGAEDLTDERRRRILDATSVVDCDGEAYQSHWRGR